MKFTLRLLMPAEGFDPRLITGRGLEAVATTAERAGFNAIAFTEHPAPASEWLNQQGHHSLDPLTALAFVATCTTRLQLMPHLLVLPYRPALLATKQAVTVDALSSGRLILCVGAGYMESEFAALGINFARRNELFDEALEVLARSWTCPEFVMNGKYLRASSQGLLPGHQDSAPLWIGGNTDAALRRVVKHGQGWTPLLMTEEKARATKTKLLTSPEDLAGRILRLKELLDEAGRDIREISIQADYAPVLDMAGPAGLIRDAVGRLETAGASWTVSQPPATDLELCLENISRFGEEVIQSN